VREHGLGKHLKSETLNCHPEPVEGILMINILKLRQAQFDKKNLLFRHPLL